MKAVIIVALAALALGGAKCEGVEESEGAKREARATAQLMDQASTAVGMPSIQSFHEKRMLKMLYELRDKADVVTYTYYVDLQGRRHKVCPTTSIGYGIPFSAQFTAPSRDTWIGSGGAVTTIMQPEPNGLYMPDSTSATWVMCMHPKTKQPTPVYVEPAVIVSTFPMDWPMMP